MIGPVVPGWLILLFAIFYILLALAVFGLVYVFVVSVYRIIHPGRDGDVRAASIAGVLLAGVFAVAVVVTADGRSERAKVEAATSISTLSESFSTRHTGSSCRVAYADGPPWAGNEMRLLDTIRADAAAFEAEGWTVTRYRASDLRRSQLQFEYEPWQARATKDDADVRIGVDGTFRYTVVLRGCESFGPPDEQFATEVERFAVTPAPNDPSTVAEMDETLRSVVAQVTSESPTRIDQVLAHGINSPLDCFVSSHALGRSGTDDVLGALRSRLLESGWTVAPGRIPLIAVHDEGAVVASMDFDRGLWIRSYPPECVVTDIG